VSLVSQTWTINACLCRLPVDPRNAKQRSADICDLSCCSQCRALTCLTLITWRVTNKCLCKAIPHGMQWLSVTHDLNEHSSVQNGDHFYNACAGNELILFYRYRGNYHNFFTTTVLLL